MKVVLCWVEAVDLTLVVWVRVCVLVGNNICFGLFTHTRHTELSIGKLVGVSRADCFGNRKHTRDCWCVLECGKSVNFAAILARCKQTMADVCVC